MLITANCNSYISLTSYRMQCNDHHCCWLLHDFLHFNRLDFTVYGPDYTIGWQLKCRQHVFWDRVCVCGLFHQILITLCMCVTVMKLNSHSDCLYRRSPVNFALIATAVTCEWECELLILRANYFNPYQDVIKILPFSSLSDLDFVLWILYTWSWIEA